MGPPTGVVIAILLWIGLVAATIIGLGVRYGREASRRQPLGIGWKLVILTSVLPLLALITIPFDDLAVRMRFPAGTPSWFVAVEIFFWVLVWFAGIGLIAYRSNVLSPTWVWVLIGAFSVGVIVAAGTLWVGICGS